MSLLDAEPLDQQRRPSAQMRVYKRAVERDRRYVRGRNKGLLAKTYTADSPLTYLSTGKAYGRKFHALPPLKAAVAAHRHDAEWPAPMPAYDYARSQLASLIQQHTEVGLAIPNAATVGQMGRVLRDVLAEDSIYPTLSIDEDGGLVAEWHVGTYSLEVDIAPNAVFSYTVRQEGRRLGRGTSRTPLRKMIRDLSTIVSTANPNWRSLFHQSQARA